MMRDMMHAMVSDETIGSYPPRESALVYPGLARKAGPRTWATRCFAPTRVPALPPP